MSSTWSGWAQDFLKAAQLAATPANVKFMHDWNAHKHSDCENNPVDLTYDSGAATNCQRSGIPAHPWYQAYKGHSNALDAFTSQFIVVGYDNLAAALQSGDPYGVDYYGNVTKDLSRWGSSGFASVYYHEAQHAQGTITAAQAHKGWGDLQHSVNKVMPASLGRSRAHVRAAQQSLRHARKVHL